MKAWFNSSVDWLGGEFQSDLASSFELTQADGSFSPSLDKPLLPRS